MLPTATSEGRFARLRRLFTMSAFGALALATGFTFLSAERTSPSAAPVSEAVEVQASSAPLAQDEILAETEPIPLELLPGRHAGEGPASFYGAEFAGRRTASGERFNPNQLTAAHRSLPMGSKVRVTNLRNGRSVIVRINDRGPFHGNRVIDVSRAAAQELGFVRRGTAPVQLELLPRSRG